MGKTLLAIVQFVAVTAVTFFATPALGAALAAAFVVATTLLFAPGPEKPPQTETALKEPRPARVSGYGLGRHYMAYALYVTDANGVAIDVGAHHDGRANAIRRYYLGDTKIVVLPDGRVQAGEAGQFGEDSDIVKVFTRMGEATETAYSEVIARIPDQWTEDHRGDGVVTGCVITHPTKTKYYQMIFPTGGPNQMPLSLVLERQLCFDWRDPAQNPDDPLTWTYTENAILHLAHYELVRDNKDWATHFLPTLAYWTAAANDCDLAIPLKGVQTIMAAAADSADDAIIVTTVNGLEVGMSVVISATGDTSLTETRTVASITSLTIHFTANLSNSHPVGSQVTWASDSGSPATEPRYRSCVAHKHTDPHKGVIANLLSCCDGWMAPRADGALVVYSGHYYVPTVTVGPDQIVSYSLQDGIEEESAVNQLAVTYISENHDFNVVDTDTWEDTDDITSRGKVLADNLSNQVRTHSQARRLAKRAISKVMAPYRGVCTTNSGGRIVLGQRYVRLLLIDAGTIFLDAPVEITKLTRNLKTGGITFEWIAADPNIDAWSPATEEGEPAPVGNRVAPLPLAAPVVVTAIFFGTDDIGTGTAGARIRITVTAADRPDLTWFARWRTTGAPTWNEQQYSDIDAGPSVVLETAFVPVGSDVEVEVAYQVGDGRVSAWSSPATPVDTGSITADSTLITADSISITADRT